MGYNRQFVTNQPLNITSISTPQQVGQTGLIGTVYTITAIFNGTTCSFTAKIQVSSNKIMPSSTDLSWSDLANSSQAITQAGNFTWNVKDIGYVWAQLVVTDGSSGANTGTLSATINVNP